MKKKAFTMIMDGLKDVSAHMKGKLKLKTTIVSWCCDEYRYSHVVKNYGADAYLEDPDDPESIRFCPFCGVNLVQHRAKAVKQATKRIMKKHDKTLKRLADE